jgi:hypothetical protein
MVGAIAEELRLRVIVPIPRSQVRWEMPAKLVMKKNGKVRKTMDGRSLSIHMRKIHFLMQDQRRLFRILPPRFFGTKGVVSNAYNHIPVCSSLVPYLCFSYQDTSYAYVGMPLGIRTSPMVFTKVMACAMNAIRARWNVIALAYLDDLLFLHADRDYLRTATVEIMKFLRWLGWVWNEEKTQMEPQQEFEWLGWKWNSRSMTVCLTADRRTQTKHAAANLLTKLTAKTKVPARAIARVIGKLSSTRLQHEHASLHLTHLN